MTTEVLTRWQACWVEILVEYDFILSYISGKNNPTDRLSCCPDYATDIQPLEGFVVPRPAFRKENSVRAYTTIVQSAKDFCKYIIDFLNHDPVVV